MAFHIQKNESNYKCNFLLFFTWTMQNEIEKTIANNEFALKVKQSVFEG